MHYQDKIIFDITQRECQSLSRKVIRALTNMTKEMQSGDDSPLKNVWDEVCVQVQGEESVMWDAYLETIQQIIQTKLADLDRATKQAIWLQTNEGSEWSMDNEDNDTVYYCEEDIEFYIMHEFVLSAAADWTNRRIERYLMREYD